MQWSPLVLNASVPEQLIKNYNFENIKKWKQKSEPSLLDQ